MYLWATSFVKRDTKGNIPLGYFGAGSGSRYFTNAMKRTLSFDELRALSKTPLARSAINQIREGILNLPYEIVSVDGKVHKKEIELVKAIIKNPNCIDDYEQFIGKLVDDLLVLDQATFEKKLVKNNPQPLHLFTIDSKTIELVENWSGNPKEYRYAQALETGHKAFYTGEKVAMIQRTNFTYDDFGHSPMQTAYNHIRYLVDIQEYASEITGNGMPKYLLVMSEAVGQEELDRLRAYIENSLQGSTTLGVISGKDVQSVQTSPIGDEATCLSWQKMLIQIIATAFNIPPEKLGSAISNDRSTTAEKDSDMLEYTIKPWSKVIERAINKHVIDTLGLSNKIEFRYIYTPTASQQTATVDRVKKLVDSDMITFNEARLLLSGVVSIELPPIEQGDLRLSEYKNELATSLAVTQQQVQIDSSTENVVDDKSLEKGEQSDGQEKDTDHTG